MSYPCSKSDARAAIAEVELSDTTGNANTSPIYKGASGPGGAAAGTKPAGETQMVGRLRAGINKPRTATDSLRRKYASTGSGGE